MDLQRRMIHETKEIDLPLRITRTPWQQPLGKQPTQVRWKPALQIKTGGTEVPPVSIVVFGCLALLTRSVTAS
jgi:hypothetical protein